MTDEPFPLLPRGVHRAPCLSPDGHIILYAVDHRHRHLKYEDGGVRYVALGDNPFTVNAELWELLDQIDPEPFVSVSGVA